MSPQKTKLQVEAIQQGTVIDHIPAGQGIRILGLFGFAEQQVRTTVGLNLRSSAGGKHAKDIIKLEGLVLSEAQANQLALFAPHATVNEIADYNVVRKAKLSLPSESRAVFSCPNSNCISHDEPVDSRFYVLERKGDVQLKCHYCEKSFNKEVVATVKN